jgi:hypothetical protein
MLNSAARSSNAKRKQHRAATAAKAVLTELGRIACLSPQLDEAVYQFRATLNLQQRHRHDLDPGAFAVAASV